MLRLVTLNLNGIRSAATKGFEAWAAAAAPDCMGVQEVKAQADTVGGRFDRVAGMTGHFHYALKKGYSGVGLYTRHAPSQVRSGIGNPEFDDEGRWVEACFDDDRRAEFPRFSVISCYFPSGSSSEERQQAKFRFLALIAPHLARLRAEREFVLLGDINIAHKEIDLRNWKGNLKNSGFLPEERAWMTHLLDAEAGIGLVDVFRTLDPNPDRYTWWSNRGQAWAKNVGWRIDYQLATPGIAARARRTDIHLEPRFSDHAPLTVDYDFTL
ncbi:MAG: exodeoxyribonuclease III [Rhizobacter sp.]